MKPTDILLTLGIVVIWGANFIVMKAGLEVLPQLLFTFLRFFFAAIPLVFFVRRPAVPPGLIAAYGLTQFAIQFVLLFGGMSLGMPAGLSSLVIQLQTFFTIGLAALMLGERPRAAQLAGAAIALAGMGLVAIHIESRTTLIGLAMVVAASVSWAFGNIYTKRIALFAQASGGNVAARQVVAGGSPVAVRPPALLRRVVEGPDVRAPLPAPPIPWAWCPVMASTGVGGTRGGATRVATFRGTRFHRGAWPSARRTFRWM